MHGSHGSHGSWRESASFLISACSGAPRVLVEGPVQVAYNIPVTRAKLLNSDCLATSFPSGSGLEIYEYEAKIKVNRPQTRTRTLSTVGHPMGRGLHLWKEEPCPCHHETAGRILNMQNMSITRSSLTGAVTSVLVGRPADLKWAHVMECDRLPWSRACICVCLRSVHCTLKKEDGGTE